MVTVARTSKSAALLLVGLAFFPPVAPVSGQETTGADDAFRDPQAKAIVLRARETRQRDMGGIQNYEAVLRERIYVGLKALRFRRERGLFEQERVARVRWSADGERAIQWIGARRAIPIVGADTRNDVVTAGGRVGEAGGEIRTELAQELPAELLRESELPAFAFDPAGSDRLSFGLEWALHPMADTADAHYHYSSGDTLRIHLPPDRDVVLYEVLVEPRRADFNLVAGSLWFDAASGALVRATYRPARPFNLRVDEPEEADDVPGFLQPVEAEISHLTVEYSLQEFEYWLPRRFSFEGEARLGRVLNIPLTVEWQVGEYEVNEETSAIPSTGPLPPGWSRREERVERPDGEPVYVTVVVPETEDLLASPELSDDFGKGASSAFSDAELDELQAEVESLLPTYQRFRPQLAWGVTQGLARYNRVEGLSVGASATTALSSTTELYLEARYGTGDRELGGVATLRRGTDDASWTLSGYRDLAVMGDWEDPFSLDASLEQFFFGSQRSQFYRTTGVEIARHRDGDRVRLGLGAFYEAQDPVTDGTDFFLLDALVDDTVASVLAAEATQVAGLRGSLNWFAGLDPNGLVLTGELLGEVADGDARYARAAATVSASHPLFFGLAGAVEAGAGALWGDALTQKDFFLGEAQTLRGFDEAAIHGPSFWRARAELATGVPGARLALFSDAGWAGPRDAFSLNDPLASVGVGASLLDGIIRLDLARVVKGGNGWRLHMYMDGLF